jgi:hypothetical protein
MEYLEFLEWDLNNPSRSDYYLAQIAREVRCVLLRAGDRKKVKLEEFLLKFEFVEEKIKQVPEPDREAELERKATMSKSIWSAFLSPFVKKD